MFNLYYQHLDVFLFWWYWNVLHWVTNIEFLHHFCAINQTLDFMTTPTERSSSSRWKGSLRPILLFDCRSPQKSALNVAVEPYISRFGIWLLFLHSFTTLCFMELPRCCGKLQSFLYALFVGGNYNVFLIHTPKKWLYSLICMRYAALINRLRETRFHYCVLICFDMPEILIFFHIWKNRR